MSGAVGCGCNIVPDVVSRSGFSLYAGAARKVSVAGKSVIALYGPMAGGRITNPGTTQDQGIKPLTSDYQNVTRTFGALNSIVLGRAPLLNRLGARTVRVKVAKYGPPELLFVSLVGPASFSINEDGDAFANTGTFTLLPGQTFIVPPGCTRNVWVNAVTEGHQFSAVLIQPVTQYPPSPYTGSFPPDGPTGKLTTIPSYLYDDFLDDDDLQTFVAAYNRATQSYVDWFNKIELPIYTKQSGKMLDWVGTGLYDIARPTLYSRRSRNVGAFNTYRLGQLNPLNGFRIITNYDDVAVTNDDVYKRVLTWHLYKGDGKTFNIAWLKRRINRFLNGVNGSDYVGSTQNISVVIAAGSITITLVSGRRKLMTGPFNTCRLNSSMLNAVSTTLTVIVTPALAQIFKEAIDTGALEMPAQYNVICRIAAIGTES